MVAKVAIGEVSNWINERQHQGQYVFVQGSPMAYRHRLGWLGRK